MSSSDSSPDGGDLLHVHAARFLKAAGEDDTSSALALVLARPALARYSIHTAAAVGDPDLVRTWLATDPALVTAPCPVNHLEPLLYAVRADLPRALGRTAAQHLDAVRALLDAGASPNASAPLPDVSDRIPALYFPCTRGDVATARLLLERGAAPTDGESLYHAAQHDHRDCLALLHEFGADLNRGPDPHGNTPLHFLSAHAPGNPVTASALRGLHWLLDHGANPDLASWSGHAERSDAGETPLHRAAALGHDESVLAALGAAGARIEARRDDGLTPFRLAARAGHRRAAAWLEAAGADPTLSPLDALLVACASGQAEPARALVAAHPGLMATLGPAERDALGQAVTRDDLEAVRLMTSLGWPLDHEGEWGGTPLHWAAWNGRVEMARLLVAAGAPVDRRDSRYGSSAIAWCAHGSRFAAHANDDDYPAVVHLLLDAGATRAPSLNRWHEAPESMARPSVVAALKARGFAV